MRFKSRRIISGYENRTSKKTGNSYTVLNFLTDTGSTFSSMLSDDVSLPADLKQLTPCNVEFEVTFFNQNVSGLKTVGLEVIK